MSDSITGASQSITLQQQAGAPAGVPNNKIAAVNGISYSYDSAGNLTNDGVHSYQYDAENRIAKVDPGLITEADYFYDANNWRVKKVAGTGSFAVTSYYIWEGGQVIAEYSNGPSETGGTSYYLADRLSTRMTTDGNGVFKGTQDQLPFGEEAGTSGTSEKHRFTNYERDAESGSDYALNRQHQYANGRFMQPDPIEGSAGDAQGLNRYSYVGNDPINLIDPLGLFCVVKYQYEYSNDGDTIKIKVIATVECYLEGGGGWSPQPLIGGDFGGGGGGGGGQSQGPRRTPPVACPLDPRSLRAPNGRPPEAPWSRLNPPERVPTGPTGPQFPAPPRGLEGTRVPPNPNQYPGFNPNRAMPPQDPSFWWKAKFVGSQLLQIAGKVFKGAVTQVGDSFFIMVDPCLIDRKYCKDPCREML